jgi:hypothetical protein
MVQFSRQRRGREWIPRIGRPHRGSSTKKLGAFRAAFSLFGRSWGQGDVRDCEPDGSNRRKMAVRAARLLRPPERPGSIVNIAQQRSTSRLRMGLRHHASTPVRHPLPSRLNYGSSSIKRHHDARRSGDFSLSSSERWGAGTPRHSTGSGNAMTGAESGSDATSAFATAP